MSARHACGGRAGRYGNSLVGAMVLAAWLGFAASCPARADACAAIRDSDRRAACQGRTRTRWACEAIRDADRRAACRAEARR